MVFGAAKQGGRTKNHLMRMPDSFTEKFHRKSQHLPPQELGRTQTWLQYVFYRLLGGKILIYSKVLGQKPTWYLSLNLPQIDLTVALVYVCNGPYP